MRDRFASRSLPPAMATIRRRPGASLALLGLVLAACGADAQASPTSSPVASASAAESAPPTATASATPSEGQVQAAPGSDSAIYAPNPAAVVVAIEAGHGGCLDWGVPDPEERGPEYAEKAVTMAIADALAELLSADGITPVLIRDGDEALAGDLYPQLNCEGAAFRDVNGDGLAGFGPDLPEATRTRDELQARLDRANLAGADVLVSIHVDSITDEVGTPLPIARTETFYTDETPWGVPASEDLASAVQASLVSAMDDAAAYEREDRGIRAHNLYLVAPPLLEPTAERTDPRRQPTRGALMPALLVEVGSITLPDEHQLLLSDAGTSAAARGIFDGLATWFGQRQLAASIGLADAAVGALPASVPGDGPPFVAVPLAEGPLRLRITNTGTMAWEAGARVIGASVASEAPYLYGLADGAEPIGAELPALAPGESVIMQIEPTMAPGRGLAWFSLMVGTENLADHGSPALQLSIGAT